MRQANEYAIAATDPPLVVPAILGVGATEGICNGRFPGTAVGEVAGRVVV